MTEEAVTHSFVVAQLGARMHYAVPRILHGAGVLEHLYTDFVSVRGWPLGLRALRTFGGVNGGVARMGGRVPVGIPSDKITHWTKFALEYHMRKRLSRSPAEVTATYLWAGSEFCRRIIARELGRTTAVYTFNSAGLELLRYARDHGLVRVVEQTSAPSDVEDRLLAEEFSAWPDWERPVEANRCRSMFADRERAEWECANTIICGSEFVRQGITEAGGPAERCMVVPYGVDVFTGVNQHRQRGDRLRVLVAGAVRLQKGAPYVLQAAERTTATAVFRWCGEVGVLPEVVGRLSRNIDLLGQVPRAQMAAHYAWADVFLLPSICEGSATVCYEALAAGLPVITTPNAGSVVREAIDGFVVPIRNAEAIAEKVDLLSRNHGLLSELSHNALLRAKEFTLYKYGERLAQSLGDASPPISFVPNRLSPAPVSGSARD